MVNPYSGTTLFSFFGVFLQRLGAFFSGALSLEQMATDEVQIFVLMGIALSSALVGVFLFLRRQIMLANALSHTMLLGIVGAYLILCVGGHFENPSERMNLPLFFVAAVLTGVLTTFLTEFLSRHLHLQEEASIGLVFTSLFAAGIVLVTVATRNVHVGTELIMGNIDALKQTDLKNIYTLSLINGLFFIVFYRGFKLTTFDAGLSKTQGFSPTFYHYLLMVLTSLTSIGAFRAVGVMMVLAFFIFPPLIARLLTHQLKKMIFIAMGVGTGAAVLGVALSRHLFTVYSQGVSTGGVCVCLLTVLYGVFFLISKLSFKALVKKKLAERKLSLKTSSEKI